MSSSRGIDFKVLAGLLEELQSAPTLKEKFALLLRARGALARASVEERRMLGAAVGVRGIDTIIERLVASRSLAGNLAPLLERAGQIDPDRVVDLVEEFEEIRETEGRNGLMERGRKLLERELGAAVLSTEARRVVTSDGPRDGAPNDKAPAAPAGGESVPDTPFELDAPDDGGAPRERAGRDATRDEAPASFPGVGSVPDELPGASTPLAEAAPVPPAPERSPVAYARSSGADDRKGDESSRAATGAEQDASSAPEASPETREVRVDARPDAAADRPSARVPHRETLRSPKSGAAAAHFSRQAPAARPSVQAARDSRSARERDASELVGRLAAEVHLARRLRLLRRWMDSPGELSMPELTSILESFPPGWSRRRALQSLLGGGGAAKIDDCVELIGTLPSAADRLWCYGTLIDSRRLSAAEREILLEAVTPGAERRRIDRRLRVAKEHA